MEQEQEQQARNSAAIDMALDDVIMSSGSRRGGARRDHSRNDRKTDYTRNRANGHHGAHPPRSRPYNNSKHKNADRVISRESGNVRISVSADRVPSAQSLPNGPRINSSLAVSNLHHEVSEDDLVELFGTVGTVVLVKLEYDRAGRSNGRATVHFAGRTDAPAASDRFHNIPLDGLPMRIEVIGVPRRSIAPRREDPSGRPGRWENDLFFDDPIGSSGAGRQGSSKQVVSAEMLDNELDSYMMKKD